MSRTLTRYRAPRQSRRRCKSRCLVPSSTSTSPSIRASEQPQQICAPEEARELFCAQARLLVTRLELGYGLSFPSFKNLVRAGLAIGEAEGATR
jgi:hypothetical protein